LLQHGILQVAQQQELEVQALEQVILPCLIALAANHAAAPTAGAELRTASSS
jgi:hypothetical protein